MPQLDPTWFVSQLFWLVVTFLALYVILSRWALPKLQGVMAQREKTIASDIDSAQSLKSQAETARQEYERTLAGARERSQQLINEAVLAHKSALEKETKVLDQQIAAKLDQAEKEISTKKKELIKALTPTAAELAAMIVEKLTHKAPGTDKINAILGELAKSRNS